MKYLFTSLLLGTVQSSQLSFIFFGDWGYNVPADQSESGIDYEGAKVAAQVSWNDKILASRIHESFRSP